jgi:hypothetical protein
MKRITLAVGSVMALFLLSVGAQKALADILYCTANSATGCSTTAPASGDYWTVTNTLNASGGTFTDTFSVAGPGSYLTAFSLTEFSGTVSNPQYASGGSNGWTDIEASKTNGGAGSCTGNDTSAFCGSDSGSSPILLSSTPTTFVITGSYTGSILSTYTLQLFSSLTADPTSHNVLAISQDIQGTPSVPDGGMTVMLLGGALVGLEALRRRLRA